MFCILGYVCVFVCMWCINSVCYMLIAELYVVYLIVKLAGVHIDCNIRTFGSVYIACSICVIVASI
jgi:hypothetical protein